MTTESESPVSEESDAPVSEDRRIYMDPDNLHHEVARLLQERPDFRQAATTVIGTRAKREADARIRELEAQLESMTLSQKRQRFQSMDADERAEALADPDVAADYADTMRKQPPNPQFIREQNAITNAVEAALDDLREAGAPDSRIEEYRAWARSDKNIDRSSAAAFIRQVQKTVDYEVRMDPSDRYSQFKWGKAPAASSEDEAQPEPAVTANPRLARGAPDTSRPDGGGKRARFRTQQEASALLMNHEITLDEMRWAKKNLPY